MQYRENREQSAEILRMALGHMRPLEIGFHPTAYTVFYEHCAGINPALSDALKQRQAKAPLTESDVLELHAKYIVGRNVAIIENIQQRLLDLLYETSQTISETGSHAVKFGASLEGHTARLRSSASADAILAIVEELVAETQQMCAGSTVLSRKFEATVQEARTLAQEVRTLTSRLQQAQAEAAEAVRDGLTGLPNRRGLERAVNERIRQSGGLEGCSMLVADVDYFKQINDSQGHLGGDTVLRAVAQVLVARTKGSDVPSRLGGDEFAVFLPDTPVAGAAALAEKVRTTLPHGKLRRTDHSGELAFTLSLGVAPGERGDTFEKLLERADKALYRAKDAGRNRIARFEPPAAPPESGERAK